VIAGLEKADVTVKVAREQHIETMLHVANEGCLVAFVAPDVADLVLAAMRAVPAGRAAVRIGEVTDRDASRVVMRTLIGSQRIIDMLIGEQLPRIC